MEQDGRVELLGEAPGEKDFSRRGFLKGVGLAGAALAVGSLAACDTPADGGNGSDGEAAGDSANNIKWDKEVDVVVVGYGGAGAATAITAHDAGAEVLIIEKLAAGGGNTACSGGGFLCPNDAAQSYTYTQGLFELSHSVMDEEVVRVYVDESMKNVEWFTSLKPDTEVTRYGGAGYAQVPGAESQDKYMMVREDNTIPASVALFGVYTYAVEERGIEVLLETPGKELITDKNGVVIGIRAESQGKEITIKARRSVVLACGGYEYDRDMLRNHVKGDPIYAWGSPGNTGDGVRMAQAVGAALWHMNGVSAGIGIKFDEYEYGFSGGKPGPGWIYVNKKGKRFVDEINIEAHAGLLIADYYDQEALNYPQIPAFCIFDETVRLAGRLGSTANGYCRASGYTWSEDNSEEISKGWIKKGETLEELASKIGVPATALAATVAKWNEDIAAGEDTLFERPISTTSSSGTTVRSAAIEMPPYYAIEQYPCLLNTQGGPKRNAKGQVLNVFDKPIPHLYSAGELGCMWGMIYQGAGNNAESMINGRVSGANVAAETPWDA
jgi:succinate dehydrogenase/fumarate reductase flavoprotein subunit